MGFGAKSLDEWLNERKTPEQRQREFDARESKIAALRSATAIDAYSRDGKQLTGRDEEFVFMDTLKEGGKPSIYKVETSGLSKDVFLFSDEWERMVEAYPVSESALGRIADGLETNMDSEVKRKSEAEHQ